MNNKMITLPKLKEIKIKGYRKTKEIKGRIINATVSREINRYYVSVLYEQGNRSWSQRFSYNQLW